MRTKITIIALVFTLFTTAHFFAAETHTATMSINSLICQATEKVNTIWKCEISDCHTDEDVYAQLAGDN